VVMFSNAKTATCPIGLLGAPSVPNPQTLAKRAAAVQQRPTVRVQDAARLGQIKRKFLESAQAPERRATRSEL